MPPNSTNITLIAPGCFAASSHANRPSSSIEPVESSPEVNESEVIATVFHAYEQSLAAALHQTIPELGALPVAHYRFLFDTDKKAPPHCVCADLIHLQADKDNARLLPVQALNVTQSEVDQLIDALNELIRDDGLEVLCTAANHCYLTGMPADELDAWPAHAVAHGKIAGYLPRKSEAGDWRRLMTEVQMLFHSHPVNEARVNAGQLPINGMWFWGGAQELTLAPIDSIDLISTDAYTCGLANAMNIVPKHPDNFDWSSLCAELIVVELGVYEAWLRGDHAELQRAKQSLHNRWIVPAQLAVAEGLCGVFTLDGCEGQAIVEKPKAAQQQTFWKKFAIRNWFARDRHDASEANKRSSKSDSNK